MGGPLKPPTNVERMAGNLATETTLTAVAALAGGPLAALLPVLGNSLAAKRQRARIEAAIRDIDAELRDHAAKLDHLTDTQYKLLNESALALLHTTDPAKLRYLRLAVCNCLSVDDVTPHEAAALSRAVRDISAEEATFLISNFQFSRIEIAPTREPSRGEEVLTVAPHSNDGLIAAGLISLGLLIGAGPIMNDIGLYTFAPLVAKLIVLFSGATPNPALKRTVSGGRASPPAGHGRSA